MIRKNLLLPLILFIVLSNSCSSQNKLYTTKITAYHDSIGVSAYLIGNTGEKIIKYEIVNRLNECIYIDTVNYLITYDTLRKSVSINTYESGSFHGNKKVVKILPNSTFSKSIKLDYEMIDKFHLTLSYLLNRDMSSIVKNELGIYEVGKMFYLQKAKTFEIANWIFWEK